MALEAGLLGPLQLHRDNLTVPLRATKQRVLLATLLTRQEKLVTVDELVHQLWEDDLPSNARNTLQAHVGRLRRAIAVPGLIRTELTGYRLVPGQVTLDVQDFDELVDSAAGCEAAGRLSEAADLLNRALGLWRGPALADTPAPAVHRDLVPLWEEQRLQTFERLVDLELRLGRHQRHLGRLRTFTREHPLREKFWCQLIVALHLDGRDAEALAAYHEVTGRLRDELGTMPGPALRALHERLLAEEPARTETRPAAPVLALPPDAADFAGRKHLLAEVARVLRRDEASLVSVCGPPGIGKTAFAVRLAHRLRDDFPGGRILLDMAGYSDVPETTPHEALGLLAQKLGAREPDIPSDPVPRVRLLRSMLAGKRVLLIVDNVVNEKQLQPLLGYDRCAVIVTSRGVLTELIARHGARPVALEPLSDNESMELIGGVVGQERLRAERADLAELAELCGHLPLAVRVAAVRLACTPGWPTRHAVDALRQQPFNTLRLTPAARPIVLDAIESSFRRLTAEEQWFLRRLGDLPGNTFTLSAAAAATGQDVVTAENKLYHIAEHGLLNPIGYDEYALPPLIQRFAALTGEASSDRPQPGEVCVQR